MSKRIGLIILVIIALVLSACESPASSVPTLTPPKKKGQQQAQASATIDTSNMGLVEAAASQTAAANLANGTPLAPDGATATLQPGAELPTLDPNLPTPTGGIPALATVTPQVVAQPTVQTARPTTYTLKDGEFIYCLARRFNVDPDQTLAMNGLVDSQTIYAGMTVKIPTTGSFPGSRPLKAHPATYTVKSGDSIYSIACQYGDVDPLNIAAVNNLADPYTLTAGAQINIP